MFKEDCTAIRAGAKVVGHVEGKRFLKKAKGSRHMLREPRGWALDCQSLEDAEFAGARMVVIEDTESGLTYSATVDLVKTKGIELNRGFGDQVAVPLQYWTVSEAGAHQMELALC